MMSYTTGRVSDGNLKHMQPRGPGRAGRTRGLRLPVRAQSQKERTPQKNAQRLKKVVAQMRAALVPDQSAIRNFNLKVDCRKARTHEQKVRPHGYPQGYSRRETVSLVVSLFTACLEVSKHALYICSKK